MPKTLKDYSNTDELHNPSSERARGLVDIEAETGKDQSINSGIDQLETYANDPENSSKTIKEAEESAGDQVPNQFNFQKQPGQQKPQNFTTRLNKFAKRRGPLAFIGGILAGAFALIAFFGGPSLLLVHMSEIFGEAFDQQHPLLETRYRNITLAKLDSKTKGFCSNIVSYRCKYGSFSERELNKFKTHGVEVLDSEGRSLLGSDGKLRDRSIQAQTIRFNGETFGAREWDRKLRTNASFRAAAILSTNTKFIGLSDRIFNDYFRAVRASKAAPYKDAKTDEERDEILRTTTSEGATVDRANRTYPADCDASCVERENERADRIDKLAAEAEQNVTNNTREAKPGLLENGIRTLSPVGYLGDVCDVALGIDAIGVGAKVVRNAQMVRYAATFLALASMIKAGDAQAEDIAYAGAILTMVTIDSAGNRSKSATDGFAFRNAAYGDSKLTESASMALGGGGLGGQLSGVADSIYSTVGGRGTCKVASNPIVQGGLVLTSLVPGVKAGGVAVSAALKVALASVFKGVAADIAMSKLLDYIIKIGIDIVSGVGADSKNMYGELAGDWIGSGTDEMFSGSNGMGGALPLTPSQAVALEPNNNRLIAEYNQAQSGSVNQLDPNSSHSLVGMTYQSLLKTTGILNTPSSVLLAPQKLLGSIATLGFKPVNAVSESDYKQCKDTGYLLNDVATTPLCHVVRGIPKEYINLNPVAVSDRLYALEQIDDSGAPIGTDYLEFIERCFENKIVAESSENNGDENKCMIKDSDPQSEKDRKGYYAVHYVDERLSDVAENGLPSPNEVTGENTAGGGSLRLATFNIYHSDGQPDEEWTARLERSIDVLKSNDISVAGLQEARPNQQRAFKRLAGDMYDIFPKETQAGGTAGFTPNPIVWDSSQFSLVQGSGQLRPISYDGKKLGHLAIVKLQATSGQQFWVMNTHDPADVREGNPAQERVDNANQYVKIFDELSAGGVPVYLTGDFNNRYSIGGGNGPLGGLRKNLTYCILTQNGQIWDAYDAANSKEGPCPSDSAGPANNAVDHIFVSKEGLSTVSNFALSPMGKERNGSDSHDTIFVDITIAGGGTDTVNSGDFAWPVDRKFYDANKVDWLEGHGLGSGSWTNGIPGIATDISSPPDDTPVYAMFSGTVTRSNLGTPTEPHGLIIETKIQGGTLATAYAHGPRTSGATTYNTGDEIMRIGNLGNSSGGHLHIDMSFNGKGVCPQDVFLAFAKGEVPIFSELTKNAVAGCRNRG